MNILLEDEKQEEEEETEELPATETTQKKRKGRCSIAYLIGNTPITPHNPSKWLFRYSITSFCMGIAIQVLGEPLESHVFSFLYKLSYLYAAIALWWEFVWQRRLLISHLVGTTNRNEITSYPIGHRVFWPFCILFLSLSLFLLLFRSLTKIIYQNFRVQPYLCIDVHLRPTVGWWCYEPACSIHHLLCFIHSRICPSFLQPVSNSYFIIDYLFLMKYSHIQRDLVLVVFSLLFFLSDDRDRTYLIAFIMPQYHCLSNLFYSRFQPANSTITSKFVFKTGKEDVFYFFLKMY